MRVGFLFHRTAIIDDASAIKSVYYLAAIQHQGKQAVRIGRHSDSCHCNLPPALLRFRVNELFCALRSWKLVKYYVYQVSV